MKTSLPISFLIFLLSAFTFHSAPAHEVALPPAFVGPQDFPDLTVVKNSEIVLPDMPRVRDQKQFNICFGMAPSILAQKHICRLNGLKNCNDVPAKLEISPLSTMSWFQKNTEICTIRNGKYFVDGYAKEVDPSECGDQVLPSSEEFSYSNVRFSGNGFLTLKNAAQLFSFHNEACFNSDRFFKKFGASVEATQAFINAMRAFYFSNRNQDISCEGCLLSQARRWMGTMQLEIATLKEALQKPNFHEFMYKLMFRECERIHYSNAPLFKQFPDIPAQFIVSPRDAIAIALGAKPKDDVFFMRDQRLVKIEALTRAAILEKSREILSQGYPLMLDNLCVKREADQRCDITHSIVIAGYREACNRSECRKFLLLQNSWGEKWQASFDGGWVDAASLLANVDVDQLRPGILSWYESAEQSAAH